MQRILLLLFVIVTTISLIACTANSKDSGKQTDENETKSIVIDAEPVEIELTEFAEQIGFTMEAPLDQVATNFILEGSIENIEELQEDHLWVIIRKDESIEEIDNREMEYYIPLGSGQFNADLNLHHGEGSYRVKVRAPDTERENYYYDVATFNIENVEEHIARDIQFTPFGLDKDLQFNDLVSGYNEAEETFYIEGTLEEQYDKPALLAEVKKDGEESQIAIPIEQGMFKGEIPLYYGQGTHEITINLYTDQPDDDENTYYHSAVFYVHNQSNNVLSEMVQYGPYIDRGLILEQPHMNIEAELDSIEYPIKGEINPEAPLAHTASHIIVEIQHADNRKDKAQYYFPVVNHKFDDVAHFRFGPGEYNVTIFVPEEEQKESNKFYFTTALELKHHVRDIEDQRDLLPSRGIESDHERILEKAQEITDGLQTEREQAKAVYEFVSKHVAYDVEKFQEDIFHPDDGALQTLESGSGICQDYAFLTIALLRSIDIESRYVQGYAGGRHAWVEAKVDGDWIEMDPTWGAGYVDRNEFYFKYNEDYFDPDPEFLEETHTRYDLLY